MLFTSSTNTLRFNINTLDKIFVKYPIEGIVPMLQLDQANFTSMLLPADASINNGLTAVTPSVTSCKLYYRKINDPISELKLKNMVLNNPLSYVIEHTKFY